MMQGFTPISLTLIIIFFTLNSCDSTGYSSYSYAGDAKEAKFVRLQHETNAWNAVGVILSNFYALVPGYIFYRDSNMNNYKIVSKLPGMTTIEHAISSIVDVGGLMVVVRVCRRFPCFVPRLNMAQSAFFDLSSATTVNILFYNISNVLNEISDIQAQGTCIGGAFFCTEADPSDGAADFFTSPGNTNGYIHTPLLTIDTSEQDQAHAAMVAWYFTETNAITEPIAFYPILAQRNAILNNAVVDRQ